MTDAVAGSQPRADWRVLLPVSLLLAVAVVQVTLATTAGLTTQHDAHVPTVCRSHLPNAVRRAVTS